VLAFIVVNVSGIKCDSPRSFIMSSKLDYLQKYLSKGDALPGGAASQQKAKKKKKKKEKKANEEFLARHRCRVIDEDDELFGQNGDEGGSDGEDKYETQEDQPIVAGIIDDRPEIEIMKERFTTSTFKAVVKVEDSDDEDERVQPGPSRRRHNDCDDERPAVKVKEEPVSDAEDAPLPSAADSDADHSPVRRRRRRHDSDEDSDDSSPPRKSARSDSDASPPRQAGRAGKRRPDEDLSPPRRRSRDVDSDASPPRKVKEEVDSDASPPRKIKVEVDSDGDMSPPRGGGQQARTLDGKKAGLQNAQALQKELNSLKKKNERKFDSVRRKKSSGTVGIALTVSFLQISAEVSGRGAETVVRGRLKAKQEEARRKKEENEITEEVKKKYSQWSKG